MNSKTVQCDAIVSCTEKVNKKLKAVSFSELDNQHYLVTEAFSKEQEHEEIKKKLTLHLSMARYFPSNSARHQQEVCSSSLTAMKQHNA